MQVKSMNTQPNDQKMNASQFDEYKFQDEYKNECTAKSEYENKSKNNS